MKLKIQFEGEKEYQFAIEILKMVKKSKIKCNPEIEGYIKFK